MHDNQQQQCRDAKKGFKGQLSQAKVDVSLWLQMFLLIWLWVGLFCWLLQVYLKTVHLLWQKEGKEWWRCDYRKPDLHGGKIYILFSLCTESMTKKKLHFITSVSWCLFWHTAITLVDNIHHVLLFRSKFSVHKRISHFNHTWGWLIFIRVCWRF